MLVVTVVGIVLLVVAAAILVISGPVTDALGAALGASPVVTTLWSILKWPVLAFVVVLMVAILYYATPNAKQPKFRWLSLGAVIAIVVLAIATAGFGFYVANFGNYDRTFGSLAGITVFLLWVWIMNIALLFGAEFEAELEDGVRFRRISPGSTPGIDSFESIYPPGASAHDETELFRHDGYEVGLMLSGELTIDFVDERVVLRPGDTISYPCSKPHRLHDAGSEPAVAQWLIVHP